jgi:hypothetical protein
MVAAIRTHGLQVCEAVTNRLPTTKRIVTVVTAVAAFALTGIAIYTALIGAPITFTVAAAGAFIFTNLLYRQFRVPVVPQIKIEKLEKQPEPKIEKPEENTAGILEVKLENAPELKHVHTVDLKDIKVEKEEITSPRDGVEAEGVEETLSKDAAPLPKPKKHKHKSRHRVSEPTTPRV